MQWRQALTLVIEVLQGSCRARCFHAWHGHVANMLLKQQAFQRKQRAVRCALAAGEALARTRRQHGLRKCLRAWFRVMHQARLAESLLCRTLQRTVGMAWDHWSKFVEGRRRAHTNAKVASEFWRVETLCRVLVHWSRAVERQEHHRSVVLAAAHAHLSRSHARVVLYAWRESAARQCWELERMQVCTSFSIRSWELFAANGMCGTA